MTVFLFLKSPNPASVVFLVMYVTVVDGMDDEMAEERPLLPHDERRDAACACATWYSELLEYPPTSLAAGNTDSLSLTPDDLGIEWLPCCSANVMGSTRRCCCGCCCRFW